MRYALFEDHSWGDLRPLTFTRPVFDLRVGIDRLWEKWNRALPGKVDLLAHGYLYDGFSRISAGGTCTFVNGKLIPSPELVQFLKDGIAPETAILNAKEEVIAFTSAKPAEEFRKELITQDLLETKGIKCVSHPTDSVLNEVRGIRQLTDIFQLNRHCLELDFPHFATGENQVIKDPHSAVYGKDNLFVHPTARIRAAILNAEDGPIYIGPGADIQEGSMIHSAHAICEKAVVNMGAKLRGDSTIGPVSKVGGEVANSVIQGYSNKGHDGYLGNSVLGYWCNLGADTNTSNLKNNYTEVRLWNYGTGRFAKTGTIFCGLVMGDHSKCGINTMFNTGTVIGVSANIFGSGYPRNFIPSFSWGGAGGFTTFKLNKAMEVVNAVMGRRNLVPTDAEIAILENIYEETARYRTWEKA